MVERVNVAPRFYVCPLRDWHALVEENACDAWTLNAPAGALWPRNRGLREYVQGIYTSAQNSALSQQQACIDSHYESGPPASGLSVSINEKLIGGRQGVESPTRHPVAAALSVAFGGSPYECPLLDWRMFHKLLLHANLLSHNAIIDGEVNTDFAPTTEVTIYEPAPGIGAYILPGGMINSLSSFAYAAGGMVRTRVAAEAFFTPLLDDARVGLVPDSRIDLGNVAATVDGDLQAAGSHFGLRAKHALEFYTPSGMQSYGLLISNINSSSSVSSSKLSVSWNNLPDIGPSADSFDYLNPMELPTGAYSWKWLLLGYDMDYQVKPTEEPWDNNLPYQIDLHWGAFSSITGGSYNPGLTSGVINNTKTISIINTDQPDSALVEVQATEMIWRALHLVTLRLYNPLPISVTLAVSFPLMDTAVSLRYRKTLAAGADDVVQLPLNFHPGEYADESLPVQHVIPFLYCYMLQSGTGADGDVPASEGIPSHSSYLQINNNDGRFSPTSQIKLNGAQMLYMPYGQNPSAYAEADTNVAETLELPSMDSVFVAWCCSKVYKRTATPPSDPPSSTYIPSYATASQFASEWGVEHSVSASDCRTLRVDGYSAALGVVALQTDSASSGALGSWLDDKINFSDYPYTDGAGVTWSIEEVSPAMIFFNNRTGINLKRTHYAGTGRSLLSDGFELTVTT